MVQAQTGRVLYNPFHGTEYLDRGGYGYLFRLPGTVIVVKIPYRLKDGDAEDNARAIESMREHQRERAAYEALATRAPHPNIAQCFLSTDLGIFLKFEPDSIEKRLLRQSEAPVPEALQFRWADEIARASCWLESFDYFHGDLRPGNVLLDDAGHAKVCDLGRARKRGSAIEVATYPFYRPGRGGGAVAGPAHEQFAVGSCIYSIRAGEVPYGEWLTPADFQERHDALVRGQYPSTGHDRVLGSVVSSCWNARYASMAEVADAVARAIKKSSVSSQDDGGVAMCLPPEEHDACVSKCRAFVEKNAGNAILPPLKY
ncbi:kinase-like protein [Xylariaceae sp. FL0804]|nr:kinase-like protein [Xylariaceae sp. FL0804]